MCLTAIESGCFVFLGGVILVFVYVIIVLIEEI